MANTVRAKDEFRGMNEGRPRRSKKKKGNAPAKTSRSGNGKRVRQCLAGVAQLDRAADF